MSTQHVRYVLCDRNHPDNQDLSVHDGGPLYCCGILHRTLKAAHRCKKAYLKGNPDIAKVTRHKEKILDGYRWCERGESIAMKWNGRGESGTTPFKQRGGHPPFLSA